MYAGLPKLYPVGVVELGWFGSCCWARGWWPIATNYSDQPARWSPQIGGSVERIYLKCPQFRLKNDSVAGRNPAPPGI